MLKEREDLNLYLDYSNNVFNDYDLLFFENCTPIISTELSFRELKELQDQNFAVFSHGRVVLMNTKYLFLPKQLKDEKRYIFPTRKEHNYSQILNSKELGLFEDIIQLRDAGIKQFYFDLDHNVSSTLELYKSILANEKPEINKKDFTRGHFERGVE